LLYVTRGGEKRRMDGKQITFGTTGFDELLEALREAGEPQDIAWLAERYIEILRKLAQTEEQE
jgi:hypothetical protein